MMKTTQFLTNVKFWQGIFVSFLLLVSLNLNSQNVGDDLLANSNGQVDTSSGWTGSGAGCFSWGGGTYDGVTQCGWTSGAGQNYAPANGSHGPTHSGDRMFKSYKTNGANGEFIAQEVGELALGTYSYSFFHKWTGGAVDYTDGAPKFSIKKANADGGWDNVLVVDLAVGETGASGAWTETAGTWENTEVNNYKIQVYKNGVANPGLAQNLHLDTFSFTYIAEPAVTYTVNITTAGGSYATEKWVNVTTEANGAGTQVWGQGDGTYSNGAGLINQDIQLEAGTYYVNAYDKYADSWDGTTLTVTQGSVVLVDGVMPDDGTDADGSGAWQAPDAGELEGSYEITVVDPSSVPALELAGIMDFDIGGSDGKAIHVRALNDIDDLYNYGLGVANNGDGTDGEEYIFEYPGTVVAGADVLVARNPDVIMAYLASTETVFEHVLLANGDISQNGDDAIELYQYDEVTMTSSVIEVFGDVDVDGTGEAWEYSDSWAYKVNGEWTYGELGCAGGETSCASSCPYPLIADFCPLSTQIDCFAGEAVVNAPFGADPTNVASTIEVVAEEGAVVADVDLYVNIDHVYNADVDIYLTSPSGTTVSLSVGNGGSSDDYSDTIFDDDASEMITSGTGPFSGAYMPENPLSALNGEPANGTWTLLVEDNYPSLDDGVFNYWGLGVCSAPPPVHEVTFNVDTRNIIVADRGMFMGGGVLGGADAVPMSDEDGDGIWTATLSLTEGTTGEWIFLNSPGDGGDWGRKENLEGLSCATGQYNDRAVPAFDADNLVFNYCFGACNDTNSFCEEQVVRHDVTFTVGTANIEVGEGGMYLGGGIMGHAQAFAMTDNGDDTHSVTVSVPEGLGGNYVFLNNPTNHYWYDGKEDLANLDCADGQYNDRYLDPVTGPTSVSFCYGTCDTECAMPNNGISEFPACFDFEGEAGLDGWQFLDLADGTVGWTLASASTSSSAFEGGQALYHGYLPAATNYSGLAISPQFNTSGMADAQLSYTEFVQWASDGQDAVVWVSTDEVLSLESENLTVVAQGISADGYTDQVIDLPEAEYVTVIFQYIGTYGHSWAIDDMCVEEVPAEPNFVTADPNNAWGGYMEVFNVNEDGSQGSFVFGDFWGVADLQTILQPDVPNMILYPNFNAYNADDPFWSNGEMGNKIMKATTQVESTELYNGADLTFSGTVAEHTLEGYETVYFIKCLDQQAGYSDMLQGAYVLPLPESGEFSVTVPGDLLPADKLVQFGFSVIGLNANPAFDYGKVVIGDVGLSLGENDSLDMVIYPNPVDGDYVTIQTPLNGDKLVEVFDVNGRKVMERLLTTDTLNVSSISAGMYIVKVTVEDQSNVSKLIIE